MARSNEHNELSCEVKFESRLWQLQDAEEQCVNQSISHLFACKRLKTCTDKVEIQSGKQGPAHLQTTLKHETSFKNTQATIALARLWLVASVCSYGGLQGAGNRDYCAVATKGVSKRNPCWPGWRPAGGRGQCVYACHRALESSMAHTDAGTDRRFRFLCNR